MDKFLGWRVLGREGIVKHRKLLIPASVQVAIPHHFRAWPAAANAHRAGEMNTFLGWGVLRRERISMRKKLLIPACVQVVGGHFHAASERKSGRWTWLTWDGAMNSILGRVAPRPGVELPKLLKVGGHFRDAR